MNRRFLKDRMILMPPNIKPSRSRNSLLDFGAFEAAWREAELRRRQAEQEEALEIAAQQSERDAAAKRNEIQHEQRRLGFRIKRSFHHVPLL
jgi:hypothetical protein